MARRSSLRLTPPPEPDPVESWHQEMVVKMCHLNARDHPELLDLFHVPNGGYRAKATAASLQRQGVAPGIPDLVLPHARGGWFALWIEMKRFREGSPTPEQIARIRRLQSCGYRAVVCRGWRSAWAELLRYLSLPATTPETSPSPYNPFAEFPRSSFSSSS